MPSLDGCFAKLDWAREHLNLLRRETGARERSVMTARAGPDPDTNVFLVKVPPLKSVNLTRCSLLAGVVITSLRAALDYLIYEATALDTGAYFPESQFPIISRELRLDAKGKLVRTPENRGDRFIGSPAEAIGLMGGGGKRAFERLTPAHQEIIAASQPYTYGFGYHYRHPLGLLANLNNQDKHRLMIVSYRGVDHQSIEILSLAQHDVAVLGIGQIGWTADPRHLMRTDARDPDAYVFSLITSKPYGPDPSVDMTFSYASQVTINDQEFMWTGRQTTDALVGLNWMFECVSNIVDEFAPDFY